MPFKNKILFKNLSALYALQIGNYIITFITLPYMVRVLAPEGYGLYSFILAFVNYFVMFTDYGFNLSATRSLSIHRDNKEKVSEIFSSVLIAKMILLFSGGILFLGVVSIIDVMNDYFSLYLFGFTFAIGMTLYSQWFFQGIEKMEYLLYITLPTRIGYVVAIFLFVHGYEDIDILLLLNGLTYIIIGVFSVWQANRLGTKFHFVTIQQIKECLSEGWDLFLSKISTTIYVNSNTFILGLIAGNEVVGYFAAADKIRIALQNFLYTLTQAVYPKVAKMLKEKRIEGMLFVKELLLKGGVVAFSISLLVFLFADQFILIVVGKDYYQSIVIMRILAWVPFIVFLSNVFGIQIMLNTGHDKMFRVIVSIGAVISLFFAFVFIPLFGAIGAAMNFALVEILVTIVMFMFLARKGLLPNDYE